jgi:xylono-1,5-lactonase
MGSRLAEISCVADALALHGEGPVWVEREQALYWVDINGRKIFRLKDEKVTDWRTPMRVGSIAPRASGGFVAGTDEGFAFIDLDAERFETFDHPERHLPRNRFNDGKLDRSGRFWAGSMDDGEREATGSLYRLDPDLSWVRVDEGYRVTNGPAFSPDGRRMYHNDSARQLTYAFDLDGRGNASNRTVLASYGEGDGYPDGMTVDAEGCLWIAFWDGWCVRRLSPVGARLDDVAVPVQRPTSCAFGGEGKDRLYITSARIGLDGTDLDRQPLAGGLFMADVGVVGLAECEFAG